MQEQIKSARQLDGRDQDWMIDTIRDVISDIQRSLAEDKEYLLRQADRLAQSGGLDLEGLRTQFQRLERMDMQQLLLSAGTLFNPPPLLPE
jgi:hypothetical protein